MFAGSTRRRRGRSDLLGSASFAALVLVVLPGVASAQGAAAQGGADEPSAIAEVVVTASRREATVTSLPFNVSAYGADQLERANVGNVAELSQQVPNFTVQDRGARSIASAIPIIRGLNASEATVNSSRYFQSPVGMYLGNAPITGGLPLMDLERVEVLRGPQGTLYGAGALSGAVRFVPKSPVLDAWEGSLAVSGSVLSHSDDQGFGVDGMVNIPLGERAALRIDGKHEYSPGFIDLYDVYLRSSDPTGAPVLANPADVANSPGVRFNKKDSNFELLNAGRVSLLVKPTEALKVEASYSYARVRGEGGPFDNSGYAGGPSILDPRLTNHATGDYERSKNSLEPFDRETHLAAVDASYDLGFATLSTTLAYGRTGGSSYVDAESALLACCAVYYAGSPTNPRAVLSAGFFDRDKNYTQEIRLVSNGDNRFDYIVGAFFQQQKKHIGLFTYAPGTAEQSLAAGGGDLTPVVLGGPFTPTFADGATYHQLTDQTFRDYSVYGELTWHVTDRWQVTGGARAFHQTFKSLLSQESANFLFALDETNQSKVTDQIFKLNTSYKLDERNQVYGTWSQGFRRGGANAFPTTGFALEPAELLNYGPDKTDNFEVGVKGTLSRVYYSLSAFYIDWKNPQIDTSTPFNLVPVVINGKKASSKGFEFELSGSAFVPELTFSLGGAYAKARLRGDFSLPAGALGSVVPDAIRGVSGDRLPGAPDWSGTATVNYRVEVSDASAVTFSLGADYRGKTVNILPSSSANTPARYAPAYTLFRGAVTYEHDDWLVQLNAANLFNDRKVLGYNVRSLGSIAFGDYSRIAAVSRPREITLRVERKF